MKSNESYTEHRKKNKSTKNFFIEISIFLILIAIIITTILLVNKNKKERAKELAKEYYDLLLQFDKTGIESIVTSNVDLTINGTNDQIEFIKLVNKEFAETFDYYKFQNIEKVDNYYIINATTKTPDYMKIYEECKVLTRGSLGKYYYEVTYEDTLEYLRDKVAENKVPYIRQKMQFKIVSENGELKIDEIKEENA